MALYKCLLVPESASYGGTVGADVIAIALDGGLPRLRKDKIGAAFQIDCQWTVGKDDYNYLQAIYRRATDHGSLPFLIDLMFESADIAEYTAQFIPQTFKLASQQGLTWVVVASLAVRPLPAQDAADDLILGRNN